MARVLVVDDEPNIRFVLEAALQQMGHQVRTAQNGLEAIAEMQAPEGIPDVVLLDLLMPKMDGREVLAVIRADPNMAGVAVALVTGSVTTSERLPPEHMYQALVNKPFDLWMLTDLVSNLAAGTTEVAPAAGGAEG